MGKESKKLELSKKQLAFIIKVLDQENEELKQYMRQEIKQRTLQRVRKVVNFVSAN